MKFKNAVFVNEKFMEILSRCNKFEDWAPRDAYWFNRFVKKIRSAQEDYEDVRIKLIKKYGKEDDEGNTKVDKEHVSEFSTDLGELMDEEFEIEGIKKISKPGLRKYVGAGEMPRVLGGLGVAIVSTSQGIMSGASAREKKMGGEVLAHVW